MPVTPASERTVEAYLTCTIDTGVKPVTETTGPDGKPRHRCGEFREHLMTVRGITKVSHPGEAAKPL